MDVLFESSFAKDLKRIQDKRLLKQTQKVIKEIKAANKLGEVRNLRKLRGHDTFYRLRLGDYRIGIEIVAEQVLMVRILHRKDIYRRFP